MSDFILLTGLNGRPFAIRHADIFLSSNKEFRDSTEIQNLKLATIAYCEESPSEIVAKINAAQKAND